METESDASSLASSLDVRDDVSVFALERLSSLPTPQRAYLFHGLLTMCELLCVVASQGSGTATSSREHSTCSSPSSLVSGSRFAQRLMHDVQLGGRHSEDGHRSGKSASETRKDRDSPPRFAFPPRLPFSCVFLLVCLLV